MTILFAAVQERHSWRKHSTHQSLANAISGHRGAESLLLGRSQQRNMVDKYGLAHAVFVWETGESHAVGLRCNPDNSGKIERISMPGEVISEFGKIGPSLSQIASWFTSYPAWSPTASLGELLVKEAAKAASTRSYRYGDKPTWQIVLDAVRSFDQPASLDGVRLVGPVRGPA